jgi:hypothetical protein
MASRFTKYFAAVVFSWLGLADLCLSSSASNLSAYNYSDYSSYTPSSEDLKAILGLTTRISDVLFAIIKHFSTQGLTVAKLGQEFMLATTNEVVAFKALGTTAPVQ